MGRSVVIYGSNLKSNIWPVFDVFLDLVILVYFNAISVDLYVVDCFIYIINFILCRCHIYWLEYAYKNIYYMVANFNEFFYVFI